VRQATAAALAAACGAVLCVAVAAPWYAHRASAVPAQSTDPVQRALEEADPSRREAVRPPFGWRLLPRGIGGRVLVLALLGTVVAVVLASRQDRLDDPKARSLAGVAALGFGVAAFYSAARLASGADWMSFGGWARVTTANLTLCLAAALVATALAVVAVFARRSAEPPRRGA
jgi:hypothetical protein